MLRSRRPPLRVSRMNMDDNYDIMNDDGYFSSESIRDAAIAKILENQEELNTYSESLGAEKRNLLKRWKLLKKKTTVWKRKSKT